MTARATLLAVATLLCLTLTASAASADCTASADATVTRDTAVAVAQHHLQRIAAPDSVATADIHPIADPGTGAPLCYLVDLQPTGYVVVAADTTLPPVVAYSLTNDAGCVDDADNPLVTLLRLDLASRRAHADRLPTDVAAAQRAAWATYLAPTATTDVSPQTRLFQQWPPAGSTTTGGWLTTNWTQNAPYNNLCPKDNSNQRTLAGCPAVAMAQILNYHARLNNTRFTDADDYYHNYGGNQFWIDNAYATRGFPSWPQLNTHLDTLFDNYFRGTAPTDTSKAALVFACGAAAQQVYNVAGSGTFGVSQAMDAYVRFGCTTARLIDAATPDLDKQMSANIMDGKPVHLAIVDASWSSGHNLVVDGYNTDGYYHLNFGWGGSYNGWYLVPAGIPFQLTVIEGVIVDIMTAACEPMDCDGDGTVGQRDFTYFRLCFAGPGAAFTMPGARSFDTDGDSDLDLRDFRNFQAAYD